VLKAATAAAGGTAELLAKKVSDNNLIIGQALAKANSVFVVYRLNGEELTLEKFQRDYNTAGSKSDFITYYETKVAERVRKKKIKENTRKNHISTLNALKAFRASIPFNTLNPEFVDDWAAYLNKHVRSLNTRWARHKDVKTYLALARKDKIKFEDPYTDFQNQSEPGSWKPLKPVELAKLEAYYVLCAPGTMHRRVLCKFLFSCYSSLRLSDLKNIGAASFEGQEMTFQIQKTYSKKMKEMMLPLTKRAMSYLEDARTEENLPGFHDYTDQYENRALTAIGQLVGIETKIHHHVGRETFATNFIRRGGKVEILQKLLDHTNIRDTMKYVHVDDDMKRAAILALEAQESVLE
jgi:integrase